MAALRSSTPFVFMLLTICLQSTVASVRKELRNTAKSCLSTRQAVGSNLTQTAQEGQYVDNIVRLGKIDFRIGQPSPKLLPAQLVSTASKTLADVLTQEPLLLQYGAKLGYFDFRKDLAAILSRQYGQTVNPEELAVTSGNSNGLFLAATSLAAAHRAKLKAPKPKSSSSASSSSPPPSSSSPWHPAVVVEDPTYFLAQKILEDGGFAIHPVPVDHDGFMVSELEKKLEEGLRPVCVYIIPTYQNPTGTSLSLDRRKRLLELAEKYGFTIIADEPYNLLDFTLARSTNSGASDHSRTTVEFPAFACLDQGRGLVVSMGSFSKIMGPGLRLGWLHASPKLIALLTAHGVYGSGGGVNPVISALVHQTFKNNGLDTYLEVLRDIFSDRLNVLYREMKKHFPQVKISKPHGGYFLWVEFPQGIDTAKILDTAQDVLYHPGVRCSHSGSHRNSLRLSFAFYSAWEIQEGVRRLHSLFQPHFNALQTPTDAPL